jgi:APA family basic amino acid/polyamine antiporter
MQQEKFRLVTATAVIVANMVGTGVFTSLGFQLLEIRSGFVLLMLWAVGGLAALCGAMTYAELGAALPRNGGEYSLLRSIYHPAAGFVSGWISSTVGFAGPTALAAMTFAAYATSTLPGEASVLLEKSLAVGLLLALTLVHATNHRTSGGTQEIFTALKVVVIVVFIVAVALLGTSQPDVSFTPIGGDGALLTSSSFAVALIYVSFAYTGWNAATYISSEVENPQRNLPLVLITGTSIVTFLYLGLNYSFLIAAPMDSLAGQVEIGAIAAQSAFGEVTGGLFGIVLALLLVSTVSAMTLAGPRVIQVIGEDFPAIRALGRTNKNGIPATAIYVQFAIALLFILSSTVESLMVFAGFTLALNSFATVLGVFVLRWRQPELDRPYRTFLFPLPPLIFLTLTGWTLAFTLLNRPVEGLFSLAIISSGLLIYRVLGRKAQRADLK